MALLLCFWHRREKWRNTKIIHPPRRHEGFLSFVEMVSLEVDEIAVNSETLTAHVCVCSSVCVCVCVCGSVTSQCLFQPPFVHHSLDDVVSIVFFLEKKMIRTYTKGHVVMLLLLTPQLEVAPPLQTMTNQVAICGNKPPSTIRPDHSDHHISHRKIVNSQVRGWVESPKLANPTGTKNCFTINPTDRISPWPWGFNLPGQGWGISFCLLHGLI